MRVSRLLVPMTIFLGLANLGATPHTTHEEQNYPTLSNYRVVPKDDATMRRVAERFEVHHRLAAGAFEVIVPQADAAALKALVPDAELLEADINAALRRAEKAGLLAGYRTFEEVGIYLHQVAQAHPEFAKLETYGTSTEGRPLYALKLSDNVATDEDEPELMIDAGTHGDEIITVEVILGLIDQLINGYAVDARFQAMIDQHEIYFLPVISPDGFSRRSRYTDGVDPNREYPWPELEDRTPARPIKALIDFFLAHDFKGVISYHASGEMVMYPWAYMRDLVSADHQESFVELAEQMSEENQYRSGQISRILYPAPGSSADFYYWKKQSIAFGVEMAQSKAPPTSQIPAIVRDCSAMTWKFIEYFQ